MKSRKASRSKKKAFDCIAFKDRVQAEIYEEIKDLTPEQEVAYFRKAAETGPFAAWWKKLKAQSARRRKANDPAA